MGYVIAGLVLIGALFMAIGFAANQGGAAVFGIILFAAGVLLKKI